MLRAAQRQPINLPHASAVGRRPARAAAPPALYSLYPHPLPAHLPTLAMRSVCALAFAAAMATTADAGCTVQPSKCYKDSVAKRVLGNPVKDSGMTMEYCAQLCSDKNLPLAGVEFSTQCMCGKALAAGAVPATSCGMPCSDPKEKCGGNDAIAVFSFKCSGAPVPAPKPPPPPPPCCTDEPCNNPPGSSCPSELYNPCIVPSSPQSKMPFCNASLPIDVRLLCPPLPPLGLPTVPHPRPSPFPSRLPGCWRVPG